MLKTLSIKALFAFLLGFFLCFLCAQLFDIKQKKDPLVIPVAPVEESVLKCNYKYCSLTAKETSLGFVSEFTCTSGISRNFLYCPQHFVEFYPQYKKYIKSFAIEIFTVALNEEFCEEY